MDCRDHGEAAAEDTTCLLELLPDDVLAHVLRRLSPRGLAVSRCVCKAWLAVVDARRLLRADLLPLSLGGLFINFHNYYHHSEFFAPRCISNEHNSLPDEAVSPSSWGHVDDHCNGLVLIHDFNDNGDEIGYVVNPATRWRVFVPPCPPPPMEIKHTFQVEYLAYDPAESPYFEVVSITRFQWVKKPGDYLYDSSKHALDLEIEQAEWPPLVCILHVFSSKTREWEERSFAREGDSMGIVSSMRHSPSGDQGNAVYWRGVLYVHCQNDYVIRISLSADKYHVIKPPLDIKVEDYPQFYLGKSTKGIYFASIRRRCRLQVWNLEESGCQIEWVLKHDRDITKWLLMHKLEYRRSNPNYGQRIQGPWALHDTNYHCDDDNIDHDMEAPAEEKIEWVSQAYEDEEFTWSSDDECGSYHGYVEILGFHPCKEIIYLSESITRGLAYHLNSSKVEVLGHIYPAGYDKELPNEQFLESSFPYTPCWVTQTADENS